jgi:hypothetical protein
MREMFETRTVAYLPATCESLLWALPGRGLPASHLFVSQQQSLRDMIPGHIGRDDGDSGDN